MDTELAELVARIRVLEEEVEKKLEERRASFQYSIDHHRIVFEESVRQQHRRLKVGLLSFLRHSPALYILSAPAVYALILPIVLLDLCVSIFQIICFPLWGVPKASRSDYVVIDRHYLAYLNGVQKLNCIYCSYANGVIAFTTEIAGRTEHFWCPIKHARKVHNPHRYYEGFLDYGDGVDYEEKLRKQRQDIVRKK
ncbi:MAG: hypothetical protein O2967_03250 [Proteobacteria bacterium]|nr:hypothetical protein [Pseudomonadota bacterium]